MKEELMTGHLACGSGPSPCRIEGADALRPPGFCDILAALSQETTSRAADRDRSGPALSVHLFVTFNRAIHRWRSIHSTVGVARLVCNGDVAAAIDNSIIDRLEMPGKRTRPYPT